MENYFENQSNFVSKLLIDRRSLVTLQRTSKPNVTPVFVNCGSEFILMPADSTTPILSLSICHFFKQWSLGLWSTPFYIVDPNHVGTYSLASNVTHRSIETRLLIGQSVGLEQHAWTPKYFGTERNTSNSPNDTHGGSCQKCILQLNHWIYFCFQIGLIQIKHTPVSGFGLILLNQLVCIFYHITRT